MKNSIWSITTLHVITILTWNVMKLIFQCGALQEIPSQILARMVSLGKKKKTLWKIFWVFYWSNYVLAFFFPLLKSVSDKENNIKKILPDSSLQVNHVCLCVCVYIYREIFFFSCNKNDGNKILFFLVCFFVCVFALL